MSELSLVYPMLALVLLTCGVLIVLFRSRVRMVREGLAPVSYFRVFQGSPEPEFAAKPTRHFTNLFEAPTLFYAGCLTAMVAGVTGAVVCGAGLGLCRDAVSAHLHPSGFQSRPVSHARVFRQLAVSGGPVALRRGVRGHATLTTV